MAQVVGDSPNKNGVVGITHASDKSGVFGSSEPGTGVRGITQSSANFGVFGSNDSSDAPTGGGAGGAGVFGLSASPGGAGVFGANNGAKGVGVQGNGPEAGISGFSPQGDGVKGVTNASSFVAGASGIAVNPEGIGPGILGQSFGKGPGVVGKAFQDAGLIGFHGDPRLQETTVANDGAKAGVFGASDIGAGVLGYSRDPGTPAVFAFGGFRAIALGKPFAAVFDGPIQHNGNFQCSGDIFLPGADCAEQFDVAEPIEPGTVVVLDRQGALRQTQIAYDKKVVGVVSGAGTHRPAIILDKVQGPSDRLPVALVGKVYCKVDAEYSPIEIGDVLTSSPTTGHAMKAADPIRAFGAVIGKALRPLTAGKGLIPILVRLS